MLQSCASRLQYSKTLLLLRPPNSKPKAINLQLQPPSLSFPLQLVRGFLKEPILGRGDRIQLRLVDFVLGTGCRVSDIRVSVGGGYLNPEP